MANEIHLTASLSCYKPAIMASAVGRSINDFIASMTNSTYIEGTVLIGTSATAFPLGQVGAPHWAYFKNLDSTNYVTIRNGSGGADLIELMAGEPCFVPLYVAANPYGVANTAACYVEYLILAL
jgi:hypothetical protein